ncbi:hypothetical protein P692DRAFT_20244665 [Suillus brevipes Sb2]|nr:hypothetical protein P692DRAFT_20244665 [Suillus brevipes Sb2]
MWGICICVKKTNSFPNEYLWSVDFIDNNQRRIIICSYLQFLHGCQRPSKHYRVIQDQSITRHNASTDTGPPDVAQTDKSRSNCAGGALLSSNVVAQRQALTAATSLQKVWRDRVLPTRRVNSDHVNVVNVQIRQHCSTPHYPHENRIMSTFEARCQVSCDRQSRSERTTSRLSHWNKRYWRTKRIEE